MRVWDDDRGVVVEVSEAVQLEALADMLADKGMWVEAVSTDLWPHAIEVSLVPMELYRYQGFVRS